MEEIKLDSVIGQWAFNHFGVNMQLAAYHNAMMKPPPKIVKQLESEAIQTEW